MEPLNITSFDIQLFFRLYKGRILKWTALGGCLGALYFLGSEPLYKSSAVYKDAGIENNLVSLGALQGIVSAGGGSRGFATAMMHSHELLSQVVEKEGMQVREKPPLIKRFSKQLGFTFKNVAIETGAPITFSLTFDADGHYEYEGPGKFELGPIPASVVVGKRYHFVVDPMDEVVGRLKKRLRFAIAQEDGRILNLYFKDVTVQRGVRFLNTLMDMYGENLKLEMEEVASKQIDYLLAHNDKLLSAHEKELADYAKFLEQESRENGVMSLKHAIDMMASFEKEAQERKLDIDLQNESDDGHDQDEQMVGALAQLKQERAAYVVANGNEQVYRLHQLKIAEATEPVIFHDLDIGGGESLLREYQGRIDQLHLLENRIDEQERRVRAGDFATDILKEPQFSSMLQALGEMKEPQRGVVKAIDFLTRMKREGRVERELLSKNSRRLRQEMIRLIDEKVATIENQLGQKRIEREQKREKERLLVQKRLNAIKEESADLSKRWLMENRFDTRLRLSKKILAGISELVESKSADHHLKTLLSKPIQHARGVEQSPWKLWYLYPLVGCFLGWLTSSGIYFTGRLRRGLAVALESLHFYGHKVFTGRDQLEQMAAVKGMRLALLNGSGVEEALALARLMSITGDRVCVIDCDFLQIGPERAGGLYHFLTGACKLPQIESDEGIDRVFVGRYAVEGPQLLAHPKFRKWLEQLEYDRILLVAREGAVRPVSQLLMGLCDRTILTIRGESFAQLAPFVRGGAGFRAT